LAPKALLWDLPLAKGGYWNQLVNRCAAYQSEAIASANGLERFGKPSGAPNKGAVRPSFLTKRCLLELGSFEGCRFLILRVVCGCLRASAANPGCFE
jgi:hypothetical protein